MSQPPSGRTGTRRLMRALSLIGDPKIKAWLAWLVLLPQVMWCFFYLIPVFMYFVVGLPPKESLEQINGIWREEGRLTSNAFQIVAPNYFIDTDSGTRQVHCGFSMQRAICWRTCQKGTRCRVYYDHYFGILAYEQLDSYALPEWNLKAIESGKQKEFASTNKMDYETGVGFYVQFKDTLRLNHGAHWLLLFYFIVYCSQVFRCWRAERI